MCEYREKVAPNDNEEPPQESPAHSRAVRVSGHRLLAAQYRARPKRTSKKPSVNKQTVEQEYQAYVTAVVSPVEVDHLKFWEVGGDTVLEHY